MLKSTNIMGTVVGSHWQMQALKEGRMTCVLKTRFTEVKRWVRYVALHAGARVRKSGWTEELVARLRKGESKGGCVLGPFKTAESVWKASRGGEEFRLGMSFRELQLYMRSMKAGEEGIYVYRFYPAEVCKRLVWNDADNLACADDWAAGFVRSRNARGGIRFYVKWTMQERQQQVRRQSSTCMPGVRSSSSSSSSCWDSLSPTRLLVLQAIRGKPSTTTTAAGPPPAAGGEEEEDAARHYEVVPASETRSYGQMSAAVLAHVRTSLGGQGGPTEAWPASETRSYGQLSAPGQGEQTEAWPASETRSYGQLSAPGQGEQTEAWAQPIPSRPLLFGERPDRAVEMAQRTEDMARSARESGTRNGMNIILVIALEKIEEGLARVRVALQQNSLHGLWLAIRDLRGAIDEYAWATSVVGREPEFMERVRNLSSIVAGMQHNLEFSLMQLSAPPFYADV